MPQLCDLPIDQIRKCIRQREFIHMFTCAGFPTAPQDPAADADPGGAAGQRLVCAAQSGGRLGHHHTGEPAADADREAETVRTKEKVWVKGMY